MKIAFVSDDHQTISAHFGRAVFYEVFTLDGDQVSAHETIPKSNPQLATLGEQVGTGEGHHHDHNAMISPILECQVLMAGGMGKGAYISLQEHDIQPIITDIKEIQTAVESYLAGTLIDHSERLH